MANEMEIEKIRQQQQLIEAKKADLQAGLPHLYAWKWYKWAWEFYQSRNPMTLLVAANQISKSSTMIRKCIEWSGNPRLWPELWKTPPRQFWYLYPSREVVTMEFHTKWLPDFLPRDAYKKHSTYGWKEFKDKGDIAGIQFSSGLILYFRTYMQNVTNLQTGTVHAIFTDEELPEHLYDELNLRLAATDGYFHSVFTATLNQMLWRLAFEGKGEQEKFPGAFKQQVSMYDCLRYMDGTPGAYTEEKINAIKSKCKSDTEIQRRVYGKFVTEVGRKYPQFDPSRHYCEPFEIPRTWRKYAAVDLGSGGTTGHPPAIMFIAVRPDFRYGCAYEAWRGDDGSTYTMGDVFQKFLGMRGHEQFLDQRYDWQAKDFKTIADRAGESFSPADKNHERGEQVVNTLFKNDMFQLFDIPDMHKCGDELLTLMLDTAKQKAKDDLADALRYVVTAVPWDWSVLTGELTDAEKKALKAKPFTDKDKLAMEIQERRGELVSEREDSWAEMEDEFSEWNDAYGT